MQNDGDANQGSGEKKESVHRRYFRLRDELGDDHPDTLRVRAQLAEKNLSRKVMHSNGVHLR